MVTKNGIVKKTPIDEFDHIRKNGLAAINLRDDDELIEVKLTDKDTEIFLVTKMVCVSVLRKQMSEQREELPWV